MNGQTYDLWRAVDADGMVLAILVQERRHQEAAETFLRRVVEGSLAEPRVAVTDQLASYGPALNNGWPQTEHRQHKGVNNRAENSHHPTRQRERAMRRFQSPHQAQRFLEPLEPLREHCGPGRHRRSAPCSRSTLAARFVTWREVPGVAGYRQHVGTAGGHALGVRPVLATVNVTIPWALDGADVCPRPDRR